MKLEKIALTNYRNYQAQELSFTSNLNVFLGENAQGKTNLLESIFVLAMARSHRTNSEKELIKWGEDFARLEGVVSKKQGKIPLEMLISTKGRKTKINHLEQRKLSDYIGQLNVILFAPEDLSLVKGSPQIRRKFLDMELGQVNPIYLYQLVQYQHILKQRNLYLKQQSYEKQSDPLFLDILSEQLAAAGSYVLFQRYRFLEKLQHWAATVHAAISEQKEELTLRYHPSLPIQADSSQEEIEQIFLDILQKNRKRELQQQTTFFGPHRDDLIFLINEQNAQTYGSQGQQRTTVLSIKLAEIDLMEAETGEYPILLLDDVLSELDGARQAHLLETIETKVQTFLTTTGLEQITTKLFKKPDIFQVSAGQIERNRE